MKQRRVVCAAALVLTAAFAALLMTPHHHTPAALPGSNIPERQLLRIWVTSAPGGGMKWLQQSLKQFECKNPGVMTYIRQVLPEECTAAEAPPDIILHMPGDLPAPESLFLPWTGDFPCDEPLLRCGRWRGEQYGLPLCWHAWVLAIEPEWDTIAAATPAPTTLLGRPAATEAALPSPTPGYPFEKIAAAASPLLAPKGGGLFTLAQLLPTAARPVLDAQFLLDASADVYQAFLSKKTASALLTTGQLTAFESLQRAGKGFASRILVPETIITDQVWLAGLCVDTPAGRALIASLLGEDAQRSLTQQGLYGVQTARVLYADGNAALVEAASRRSMTAINAYVPAADVSAAAWQVFFGHESPGSALMPLI